MIMSSIKRQVAALGIALGLFVLPTVSQAADTADAPIVIGWASPSWWNCLPLIPT